LSASVLPLASQRILVIDDQPSIRGVLQVALEEAGADVWTAGDGESALLLLRASLPDAIVLDQAMPGMDGWAVIESLRAARRTSGIPVVLATSAQDLTSFDRARKLGIAAFVSKPFRLHEVIATIRRILDGARPLQGRPARDQEGPTVQIRERSGALVGLGRLLDLDARGAQIEFDRPLASEETYMLVLPEEGGRSLTGEVRWVRKAGDAFHHGLRLRD
jgi:CheY-like chemotaxis protein